MVSRFRHEPWDFFQSNRSANSHHRGWIPDAGRVGDTDRIPAASNAATSRLLTNHYYAECYNHVKKMTSPRQYPVRAEANRRVNGMLRYGRQVRAKMRLEFGKCDTLELSELQTPAGCRGSRPQIDNSRLRLALPAGERRGSLLFTAWFLKRGFPDLELPIKFFDRNRNQGHRQAKVVVVLGRITVVIKRRDFIFQFTQPGRDLQP